MTRTYELVYVIRPDATEQQVADLHTQVEQIVGRTHGAIIAKNEAQQAFGGPPQARLRDRPSQGRDLRPRSDHRRR